MRVRGCLGGVWRANGDDGDGDGENRDVYRFYSSGTIVARCIDFLFT